jgi:hypothetical protein
VGWKVTANKGSTPCQGMPRILCFTTKPGSAAGSRRRVGRLGLNGAGPREVHINVPEAILPGLMARFRRPI